MNENLGYVFWRQKPCRANDIKQIFALQQLHNVVKMPLIGDPKIV